MSIRTVRTYYWYFTGQAKYLFIHIPKNAGITIRRAKELRGRILPVEAIFHKNRKYTRRLIEVMEEGGEHHGIQHARLRDVSPKVVSNLQPFAVVRNPWARVVSRYTFAKKAMETGSAPPDYAARSFEQFLEERHIWGNKEFFWHRAIRGWFPQVDYITDDFGNCPAHILRAESLDDEATRYFGLREPLQRQNVSNNKEGYKSFYTPSTIQIIADWYAADIEAFGFDFDTSATRNFYFEERR